MMWSFSLRGDLVYGYDISTEYYDLQQTVTTGIWHTAHPRRRLRRDAQHDGAAGRAARLAGVPDVLVFKVVYPAIIALFPVAVFWLARRVLSPAGRSRPRRSSSCRPRSRQELPPSRGRRSP